MNILIVHAHPEPKSFTTAMKDLAVTHFEEAGDHVQLSDLYAMGWNPVASAEDFGKRRDSGYLTYALEQRHAFETESLASDIAGEVEKLLWADLVIFSFPVYWFSVPAILKGWFDRVLLSGPIYGGKRFYDKGGLRGKKAMLACTLGGRDHMFGPDAIHGEIEVMLRPILRGTLYYTGFEVLPPFIGWHIPYISEDERVGILRDYKTYLNRLEDLDPLKFPTLDQFDDRLFPKKR